MSSSDGTDGGGLRLEVRDASRTYTLGRTQVEALKPVSLELTAGEALAVTGPSGSGKSTLLHLVGTLETPSSGRILYDGREAHTLPEKELARFRNRTIGFVFQDHHLLPQFTVLENVLLPTRAFSDVPAGGRERALDLLQRVGLAGRLHHRPAELSGGERQRTAVARGLINGPRLLLCDEPTGSLDPSTADAVGNLLLELHRQEKTVLMVVTHSAELAGRFPRRLELA